MPTYALKVKGRGEETTYSVDFPYDAYDCQVTMMERVVEALHDGEHALLESPTGTGKTLCLLCATLGWRERAFSGVRSVVSRGPDKIGSREHRELAVDDDGRRVMEKVGAGVMSGPDADLDAGTGAGAGNAAHERRPLIIYASRTHSQLAQVIRELKSTKYRPRMAVIGSRQQMCVHKDVRTLTGAAQNAACRARTASRSCAHHNELESFQMREPDFGRDEPVDVEDLVRLGERGRVGGGCGPCPYFLSLDMYKKADIVFMPYNYVIDPGMRDVLGDRLKDAVVLLDEAHNIESVCSDAASFDLPAAHLAQAINEAQEAFEAASMEEERSGDVETTREAGGLKWNARGGADASDGYGGGDVGTRLKGSTGGSNLDRDKAPRPAAEYKQLRTLLLALEDRIAAAVGKGETESVQPGEALFDLLASLKITERTAEMIRGVAEDASVLLAGEAADRGVRSKSRQSSYRLNELTKYLDLAFKAREAGHTSSFRLRVGADESRGSRSGGAGASYQKGGKPGGFGAGHGTGPTLSFWCFSPGVAMSDLKRRGVKSVVLTSGTLSPMTSFASELGLNFKVRLENPHVIDPGQVWGGVVPVGPSGKRLNSTYRFRDTDEYKSELGNVIVNCARIVPDGMLVFFPSYGVMRSCVEHWRNTGNPSIWDRVCASKHAVVEPTGKEEFREAFKEFNDALEVTKADGGSNKNGAAFFAVCRGKVSEGIDFADKAGRCVVLTGIPYAPKADAKVRIKRSFLDTNRVRDKDGLTGEEWYSQGAMRAVNQALGRVIRHRHDFGAVVLADERFAHGNVRNQLSVWLRPAVQPFDSFGKAAAKLTQFFKHHAGDRPRLKPAAEPNRDLKDKDDAGAKFETLGGGGGGGRGIAAKFGAGGSHTRGGGGGGMGLLGKLAGGQFAVDVDAAPPAYPRGGDNADKAKKKAGGLAAMLQAGKGGAITGDKTNTAAQKNTTNANTNTNTNEDRVRLFMRRARSELTARAHEDLTTSLRAFRAGGGADISTLLRLATRTLRADDDAGPNSLYAAFSALVPESHRHLHDKHLEALRARDSEASDGGGGGGGSQPHPFGRKRVRPGVGAGAGTALSRDAVGGSTAMGRHQRDSSSTQQGGHKLTVANPPPRCVLCGNAARKPFEAACKHPACYSCWLELLGRDGSGNAKCPSCHKPVLKRQLQKMFFT